ncbi:MAG: hypothetical protein U5L45_03830 [Saprospiraceae bacterium]|nr:hypothetical protein [Saprospiraceae bacterium]
MTDFVAADFNPPIKYAKFIEFRRNDPYFRLFQPSKWVVPTELTVEFTVYRRIEIRRYKIGRA